MPSVHYVVSTVLFFAMGGCARHASSPPLAAGSSSPPIASAAIASSSEAGSGPQPSSGTDAAADGSDGLTTMVAAYGGFGGCGCRLVRGTTVIVTSDGKLGEVYTDAQCHRTIVTDGGALDGVCRGTCAGAGTLQVLREKRTTGSIGGDAPYQLVADATDLYWSNSADHVKYIPGADEATGSVWTMPKGGGKARRLASHLDEPTMTSDAKGVYFRDHGKVRRIGPGGHTGPLPAGASDPFADTGIRDGVNLYSTSVTDEGHYVVFKQPLNGGPKTTLVSKEARAIHLLTVDEGSVYWLSSQGLTHDDGPAYHIVRSVPKQGGDAVTVATWPECFHSGVVDGTSVYFSTGETGEGLPQEIYGSGEILKVPLRGGAVTTLATMDVNEGTPVSLVVDRTSVYWLDSKGRLLKVTK
jgi:hypothetical protein